MKLLSTGTKTSLASVQAHAAPSNPQGNAPFRSASVLRSRIALLTALGIGVSGLALESTASEADGIGPGSARLPITYRSWKLESSDSTATGQTTITQLHVPVVSSVRLGRSADLVLSTAYGNSGLEVDPGGGTAGTTDLSMSGNGDVKAQLFVRLFEDRFLVQGGVGVPAGTKGLDAEQLAVVQALGNPILGFRMKHYGEGLDISGGGALAVPLGSAATAAVGAGFVVRGPYEFVENEPDFQPGQETSVSAGVDFVAGNSRPAVRLDASYRIFGADQLDGTDVFQEGNQIELQATTAFRPGKLRLDLAGRLVLKDDNEILNPPGDDVDKIAMDAGTAYFGQLETGLDFGGGFFGVGASLVRFDGGDPSGDAGAATTAPYSGTAYGVGPILEFALGSGGRLRLGGQYLLGSIDEQRDTDDEVIAPSIDLSGFDATVSLNWNAGSR